MSGARFHDLPEQLQDVIFCKLPLTSIATARRVCKQWRAKLRSQNFLVMYRDCETRPREQWIVDAYTDGARFGLFSLQDRKWMETSLALPPSLLPRDTPISLVFFGSCLGLWCIGVLVGDDLCKLVLCDPITGRIFKEIPLPWKGEWEGEWDFWGIAPLGGSHKEKRRDRMVVAVASIPSRKLFTFNTEFSIWSACDIPGFYTCLSPVTKLPFFAVGAGRDVKGFDPEAIESPWLDLNGTRCGISADVGVFGCMGEVYMMVVEDLVQDQVMGQVVLRVHRLGKDGEGWDFCSSMEAAWPYELAHICSNEVDKIWVCSCEMDQDPNVVIEFDVRSKEWTVTSAMFFGLALKYEDKVMFLEA